ALAHPTDSANFGPQPLTDSIVTDPNASFLALQACKVANSANPGACPQGSDPQTINSALARLTLQVSARNKLSAYLDRIHKDRAHAMGSGSDERITSVHWNS